MEDDLWKMAGVRELVSHQEKDYKMAPTRLPSVDTLRRERWLSSIASQRFSPGRLSGSRGFAILVLCQDLGELPPRLAPDQLSASAAFPYSLSISLFVSYIVSSVSHSLLSVPSHPLPCSLPPSIKRSVHCRVLFCTLTIIWIGQSCPRLQSEPVPTTSVPLLH